MRDTEHAVRQCEALAQHRSVSVVRSSPTRAQRGTRPKNILPTTLSDNHLSKVSAHQKQHR
ncbi:MAG: hypothetical protein NZ455_09970 [Bacteroidia bacterium]|nr:hypothetical protein [Bacteroidia bacterium]MDW8345529.1 hypothetical protein [Bacteroidia bacterium]